MTIFEFMCTYVKFFLSGNIFKKIIDNRSKHSSDFVAGTCQFQLLGSILVEILSLPVPVLVPYVAIWSHWARDCGATTATIL